MKANNDDRRMPRRRLRARLDFEEAADQFSDKPSAENWKALKRAMASHQMAYQGMPEPTEKDQQEQEVL